MCRCRALCAKSFRPAAPFDPCSYPRSPAARHRPATAPAPAPARAAAAPPNMRLGPCPPTPRRRRVLDPRWRRPRGIRSRSSSTRIRRTMRLRTASTFDRINRPMSTFRLPSTILIARRPKRPSSIWEQLWLWVPLVVSFSWLLSSRRSSSWSEGECQDSPLKLD